MQTDGNYQNNQELLGGNEEDIKCKNSRGKKNKENFLYAHHRLHLISNLTPHRANRAHTPITTSKLVAHPDLPQQCVVRVQAAEQLVVELAIGHEAGGHTVDGNDSEDGLDVGVDKVVDAQAELVKVLAVHENQARGIGRPAAIRELD